MEECNIERVWESVESECVIFGALEALEIGRVEEWKSLRLEECRIESV